jgi:hypothetical protein
VQRPTESVVVEGRPSLVARWIGARPPERWISATALAGAAVALGHAIQLKNGSLEPEAVVWVTVALALAILAAVAPPIPRLEALGPTPALAVLGAGLAWHFADLLTRPAGVFLRLESPAAYEPFLVGCAGAAVLAGAGLARRARVGGVAFPLLVLTYLFMGGWIVRASPDPFVDVVVVHRDAIAALLRGIDPYAITFPNIYPEGSIYSYPAELLRDGRTVFGFPYPPLSLILSVPGHLLGGDYRYSQVIAMGAAALLTAYARPGAVARTAAAVMLFTPRGFFVIEQGWTEPFVILLLAAAVFCAVRAPRLLGVAFGLFVATKQYALIAIPLALWLVQGRRTALPDLYLKAGIAALAVTAPLALWHLREFFVSVVLLQIQLPLRPDALSYLAWLAQNGGPQLPAWIAFAALVPVAVLAVARIPRTPAGFAMAVAVALLVFFALNKAAFANYYFLVIGAMCCSIALTMPARDRDPSRAGNLGAHTSHATLEGRETAEAGS